MEHFPIEEDAKRGAQCLVLGRGGDVALGSEVSEKSLDFWSAHVSRMTFVMEKDVAAHPVYVGLFGAVGVVFCAQKVAGLVE